VKLKNIYTKKIQEFTTKELIESKADEAFVYDQGQLEAIEYKLDMLTEMLAKVMDVLLTDEQKIKIISPYKYELEVQS